MTYYDTDRDRFIDEAIDERQRTDIRCGSCAYCDMASGTCKNKAAIFYELTVDEAYGRCVAFCRKLTTRQDLVDAWHGIDRVLTAMYGVGDEITDREAFTATAKAVWLLLDSTVRGIDNDKRRESETK